MASTSGHQVEVRWTQRQREVLDLLAKGCTNGEIGQRLGISLDGAKWHVSEVMTKLGVEKREQAAEYWRHHNRPMERTRRSFRSLVAPPAVLLAAGSVAVVVVIALLALSSFANWGAGTSAGSDDSASAVDATKSAGVATAASPTPIAPVVVGCPEAIGQRICDSALALVQGLPSTALLKPITITCPPEDAWLLAVEPVCSRRQAGTSVSGFVAGAKQFSFVDEATLRAELASWTNADAVLAGIACPRQSYLAPLDCASLFAVLLDGRAGGGSTVLLFSYNDGSRATVFGAHWGLAAEPERSTGGGWVSTAHAGVQQLPERMWLVPWQP